MAAGCPHSAVVPAFDDANTVTFARHQPGADQRRSVVAAAPDGQPAQPLNTGGINFMAINLPPFRFRAAGRHGLRQAAARRGAQFRLHAQAVDQSSPLNGIVKNPLAQRLGPVLVFRQPQMMQVLHADDQRRRRFAPGNSGNRLLEPGKIGTCPAVLQRYGEA